MVITSVIPKNSSPFTNLFGIIQCAPITIDITVTLIIHKFF